MKAIYSHSTGSYYIADEERAKPHHVIAKLHRHGDARELAYEFAAAKDMRKALQDLMDDCEAVSSYCEFCEKHAPVGDDGMLTGPIPHTADCSYGNAERALAKAAGNRETPK